MTKHVLVTISGLHYDDSVMVMRGEGASDSIEIVNPATYYMKKGKHYIFFDEFVEGMPGTIKNRIIFDEGNQLEIHKTGLTNSRLFFEKGKINVTPYQTPYGELLMGTYTRSMDVDVQERLIDLRVRYSLDINGEKAAECDIQIRIEANE